MKKLMLVLGLMAIVFISRANENTVLLKDKKQTEKKAFEMNTEKSQANEEFIICTVTQTAKVSIYFVDYTVSCSSSAETCEAAIESSLSCISAAVNRLKQVIK